VRRFGFHSKIPHRPEADDGPPFSSGQELEDWAAVCELIEQNHRRLRRAFVLVFISNVLAVLSGAGLALVLRLLK
jgi:hypothetical protein